MYTFWMCADELFWHSLTEGSGEAEAKASAARNSSREIAVLVTYPSSSACSLP